MRSNPENPDSAGSSLTKRHSKRRRSPLLKVMVTGLLVFALYYFFLRGGQGEISGATFTAVRGPMEILVLEGGSIEARESYTIKSEVQGQTKILSIIEEGYYVTPEDVANGLILVELDSKELVERQTEQELQYQNSKASFTEAQKQFEIQLNQNASDIKTAELEAKFARMDFEKYMGEKVANEIIRELKLDVPLDTTPEDLLRAIRRQNAASENTTLENERSVVVEVPPRPTIDFIQYAAKDLLGDGQARQRLRSLDNTLVLSQEEVGLAETDLEGTKRLLEQDFVTRNQYENDMLGLRRKQISLETAETSRELFIRYEFPKEAEKLLSDYEEALRKLERAKKLAESKMAQAEAKLNSAEATFQLQTRRRREIQEQIQKCTIRAERPGLVVYGSEDSGWRQERIEEGATVRERQVIITIPDTTHMNVNVKVHESVVQRVQRGQQARIRVDANPEILLTGEVNRIAVLPDSQNRWMNPDMKVYPTTVHIHGTHDWLKPGMSAQTQIIIDQLDDVLQIPLQAVFPDNGQQVCYVAKATGYERRVIETGQFNDSLIVVKNGLKEGESVLLRAPVQPDVRTREQERMAPEERMQESEPAPRNRRAAREAAS